MHELTDAQVGALRTALERPLAELDEALESSVDGARPVDLDEPIGRLSRMDAAA